MLAYPIIIALNVSTWHNRDLQHRTVLGLPSVALPTFGAECRFTAVSAGFARLLGNEEGKLQTVRVDRQAVAPTGARRETDSIAWANVRWVAPCPGRNML
jgi:hypothetical protein